MRKIKFRGRSINYVAANDSYWAYGLLVNDDPPEIECDDGDIYRVNDDTVGQYTGLEDADGREIYEGDILQKRDELAWRTVDRGVVFWHSGECRWCVEMCDGLVFSFTSRKSNTWRVIGNIHDNPELLEVEA